MALLGFFKAYIKQSHA